MSLDPFFRGKMEGRRFVPREGQSEYLHPDYLSGKPSEGQDLDPESDAPSRASRSVAVKLVVMAVVMLAILVGIIVVFT